MNNKYTIYIYLNVTIMILFNNIKINIIRKIDF